MSHAHFKIIIVNLLAEKQLTWHIHNLPLVFHVGEAVKIWDANWLTPIPVCSKRAHRWQNSTKSQNERNKVAPSLLQFQMIFHTLKIRTTLTFAVLLNLLIKKKKLPKFHHSLVSARHKQNSEWFPVWYSATPPSLEDLKTEDEAASTLLV